MSRAHLSVLQADWLPACCRQNVIRSLAPFGSFRQGRAGPESDVDLPVEFEPRRALALTRLVEIIAGAAATLSPGLGAADPEPPWCVRAATRKRLLPAYFNVDLPIVLDTAGADLPPLIVAPEAILDEKG